MKEELPKILNTGQKIQIDEAIGEKGYYFETIQDYEGFRIFIKQNKLPIGLNI